MQHLLTPYNTSVETYAYWENIFTDEELNWIQNKAIESKNPSIVQGKTSPEVNSVIRRSRVSWLEKNQETFWLYNKISHSVSSINAQFFRFDLTGFGEPFQLSNYDHSENGTYGWHVDYGGRTSVSRKLSVVLQLTDPSEYEGGNLQLMVGSEALTIKKQRGLLVAFPSFTLHQVTPVTSGSRQSLVTWVSGPPFK